MSLLSRYEGRGDNFTNNSAESGGAIYVASKVGGGLGTKLEGRGDIFFGCLLYFKLEGTMTHKVWITRGVWGHIPIPLAPPPRKWLPHLWDCVWSTMLRKVRSTICTYMEGGRNKNFWRGFQGLVRLVALLLFTFLIVKLILGYEFNWQKSHHHSCNVVEAEVCLNDVIYFFLSSPHRLLKSTGRRYDALLCLLMFLHSTWLC